MVYHKNVHGSHCASEVLAYKPGQYVGSAPDANAIFAITDDNDTETPQDEFNFVAALEWADSLGADVISASIGYKNFNDPRYNYTYEDMDGRTAISTRGCRVGASKGLIIVNSAGNSARICAPCDADSILCVGGAHSLRGYDGRSSYGPSYDRRVKPDVSALTINAVSVDEKGAINYSLYGGTSSAAPQIAGLAVCLKQSHPMATNIQIIQAIRMSGHRYLTPDSLTGYGVPDACKADSLLSLALSSSIPRIQPNVLRIFPNPATDILYIESSATITAAYIVSMLGQRLKSQELHTKGGAITVKELPAGTYIVQVQYADGTSNALRFARK